MSKGKGVHTRPNFGEVCIFNVTTRLEDGTVVDQKTNFKCILGHLEVVQGSSILVNKLYFFLKLNLPRKILKIQLEYLWIGNVHWVPLIISLVTTFAYNEQLSLHQDH